jgi:pimeloyl-ACP methyl ester carboxylesterase
MEIGKGARLHRSGRISLLAFCAIRLLFAITCRAEKAVGSEYIRQANKDSVIVFVHGVLGDPRTTWINESTKAYWPALMKDDPYFNDFDIFVVGYPSRFWHDSYSVDELVEVMRRDLDDAQVFAKHKHVYFLCHSMGGLVVRGYLTRYQKRAAQIPMIYFFSTPTTGTQVANLARLLSSNRELWGLAPSDANEYLASVQKGWLAAEFSIASYCAYETLDTYGIRIVDQESATNLCNRRLDPIDADHIDIVKPRDMKDAPYIAFRSALQEVRPEPIRKSRPPSTGVSTGIGSPIEGLANLGWTVNPGAGNPQFNDNYNHISMRKSVKYFCAMNRPFSIVVVGAKTLDGVSGLREAKYLTNLAFDAPEFSDLSELRDLRNLQRLEIAQTTTVSDLSPLQGLAGLKELVLGSAGIRDLGPIQGLHNITALQIGGTQVSDLSPLRNFRNLRTLNVTGTRVMDFSAISDIETIEFLSVNGRQLAGLLVLRDLPNFKKISLFETDPVDLSPIGELGKLESLQIDGPRMLNLAPLRRLSRLSSLWISPQAADFTTMMQVEDVAAIGELHELRKLTLMQVLITDLSFMRGLPNLAEFTAMFVPLSNINGIEGARALSTVQLSRTNVVDISPLLRLPGLTEVSVAYTPARSDVLTELERRGVKVHR